MTPQPVSGFEQTYYEYSLLCDFDGADIGQLFAQYLLNGEQRHVFATFLVRWEDGKIAAVDKIGCELPESKPGDNSFQVYPCLWDVGGGQLPDPPQDERQGGGQEAGDPSGRAVYRAL